MSVCSTNRCATVRRAAIVLTAAALTPLLIVPGIQGASADDEAQQETRPAENPINNPGFEDGDVLRAPLVTCIKYAHKGMCSAKYVEQMTARIPYFLSTKAPLEGQQRFTASVWTFLKERHGVDLFLRLWYAGSDGERISTGNWETIKETEETWTHHTVTAERADWPEGAVSVGIYIFWLGPKEESPGGIAYLDDLSLTFE